MQVSPIAIESAFRPRWWCLDSGVPTCGIVSDTALAACMITHDNKRVEVEPSPHSGLAIRACKARYGKCPGALKFCSDVMIESRVWLVLKFFFDLCFPTPDFVPQRGHIRVGLELELEWFRVLTVIPNRRTRQLLLIMLNFHSIHISDRK